MESVILIAAITCLLLMIVAFVKPSVNIGKTSVSIFWIVPFIGAIIMILTKNVSINEIITEFTSDSAVNPLKILILF